MLGFLDNALFGRHLWRPVPFLLLVLLLSRSHYKKRLVVDHDLRLLVLLRTFLPREIIRVGLDRRNPR